MSQPSSITISVQDRDGSVVQAFSQPARSYVQAMIQRLRSLYRAAIEIDVRNIGNTLMDLSPDNGSKNVLKMIPALGNTGENIIVGSGTTAVAVDDFGLATGITHGVAAGQLQYQAVVAGDFGAVAVGGGIASFTTTRLFINGSGADVTVRELGLVAQIAREIGANGNFLIARDVLGTPIVVGNGQTLTVTYTIGVSV